MSIRKRRRKRKDKQAPNSSRDSTDASEGEDTDELVPVGDWHDRKKPVWRRFPGPEQTGVALRVAIERRPYAELVGHAKESLDMEVCGVLVGDVCEDEEGLFVDVKATIRGAAARAGSAHVTYTQETWNDIHRELEQRYPDRSIVGWYHSHPGFGVTFSEMDVFIQQNFFP
ncbi:MAG: Mov34/MPN/PAD-1 family protein, partial [Gemmatimonadota bacterium]